MARGGRRRYDEVDGLLLLNKPPGMTSNRALQVVRRLLNAKKAGGTLISTARAVADDRKANWPLLCAPENKAGNDKNSQQKG